MFLPDNRGSIEQNTQEFADAGIDLQRLIGNGGNTFRHRHFDMIAQGISLLLLTHCNVELEEPTVLVDTRKVHGLDRLFLNEGVCRLGTALDTLELIKDCTVLAHPTPNHAIQQFELTNGFCAWMQGPTFMSSQLPASVIVSPHSLLPQSQNA